MNRAETTGKEGSGAAQSPTPKPLKPSNPMTGQIGEIVTVSGNRGQHPLIELRNPPKA